MAVHEFKKDLKFSTEQEEFLAEIYQGYFNNMINSEFVIDLDMQKSGIDRIIHLSNGKTVTVDEKIRRIENTTDILLEYVSNNATGALGWIEKDSAVDYICYIWLPAKKAVLLPFFLLRKAWLTNKEQWLSEYKTYKAYNQNYHSLNVAIPTKILMQAIRREMFIEI